MAMAARTQGVGGAAKVAIVAAVVMMGFCVLRLGRYIAQVPHAVVTGFSCGIGGMMLVSQLDTILGISSAEIRHAGSTIGQLAAIFDHLNGVRPGPFILGSLVIVAATVCARWTPHAPAPLLGVGVAVIGGKLAGFHEREVGAFASGLPGFVGFAWRPTDVFTVLPSSFALAFVISVNLLMTSRVVEHFRGKHPRMKVSDADAELGAYGIANLLGGMFGAPPSVGIPARSLAVVRCGGTTRLANLFHAVFLVAMLVWGTAVIAHIPIPALAGITAWMGLCLLDWSAWRRLPRMKRVDAVAFLATAAAVLAVNAVLAVGIGCSVYALHAMYGHFSRPVEGVRGLETPLAP
jgi:SulP family sulfate permease